MEALVRTRNGSVLGKGSILKMYFFPGQRISSHIQIHGAPHVYKVWMYYHWSGRRNFRYLNSSSFLAFRTPLKNGTSLLTYNFRWNLTHISVPPSCFFCDFSFHDYCVNPSIKWFKWHGRGLCLWFPNGVAWNLFARKIKQKKNYKKKNNFDSYNWLPLYLRVHLYLWWVSGIHKFLTSTCHVYYKVLIDISAS